jgi:hypothetical protein
MRETPPAEPPVSQVSDLAFINISGLLTHVHAQSEDCAARNVETHNAGTPGTGKRPSTAVMDYSITMIERRVLLGSGSATVPLKATVWTFPHLDFVSESRGAVDQVESPTAGGAWVRPMLRETE